MKKSISLGILLVLLLSANNPAKDFTGFSPVAAKDEQQLEVRFDSLVKSSDVDNFVKYLSARPHHLGSVRDRENAEYILGQYRSWGYTARIDTFYALFATPEIRLLEGIAPVKFKASLAEPALKEDATSNQASEQLPPYNCYSADGDVTAELVYVNYGAPVDYDELARRGIDVKGKIVIARYGSTWRGIKPRLAQEHGAIGCIIYSDPADDGYYKDDVYPKGPMRNENGVQRGSVMDIPLYPGDPLTPGYADTKNAKRLDRKDVTNLLKIPVLPISYADAKPFLAVLTGPVAPENWRGGLPFTYHIGPGPVKVHLKLQFNWSLTPVYDVIAVMKGSQYPDEWVLRGNHQDAWVNGAADPLSGQAAMLVEAHAVGQLAKQGFGPKRTIVYCSWDGEEEGLLGSTEWTEANADELQQKAVAYINSDVNGRGFLGAAGSHTLQNLVNEVAGDVTDPEMKISVLERARAQKVMYAGSVKEKQELLASPAMKIEALGSGSDFSPFLQHLGIASLDVSYGGEDNGGEYHSIYDSYDLYRRFKDPGFVYGVVEAKTTGRIILRLANADVLPFDMHDLYTTIDDYIKDISKKLDEMRTATALDSELLAKKYFTYVSDPTKTYGPPKAKVEVPYLDFSPLQNAMAGLKKCTGQLQPLVATATTKPITVQAALNQMLYKSERSLLMDKGLPDRPWYKHAIYAPGYYTGYGVKTIPGVREAIENRNYALAQQQINEAGKVLNNFTGKMNEAIVLLEKE